MKNLVIVGCGGFFFELYDYLMNDISFQNAFIIKGVLDDNAKETFTDLPILGTVASYQPSQDELFIIAIGNVHHRKRCYDLLKDKGATFYSYVHPTAYFSKSAIIGEGCIIAPYAIINARAVLEANIAVNVHCSVGHEAKVGFSSVLSPYSALNGCSKIGELCFLGTRATVFPGKTLGDKCIVDSHSYVKSDVPPKSIVSTRSEYTVVKNRLMR